MFFYSSLENWAAASSAAAATAVAVMQTQVLERCHVSLVLPLMKTTRLILGSNRRQLIEKTKLECKTNAKPHFFCFVAFSIPFLFLLHLPQQQQKLFNESNKKGFYFEKDFGQNSSDEKNIKQNIFDQKTRKSGDCMMPSWPLSLFCPCVCLCQTSYYLYHICNDSCNGIL